MTNVKISIGQIVETIDVPDEDREVIENIARELNKEVNEYSFSIGRVDTRILLFILLLINTNKKERLISNFSDKIFSLLKAIIPLLSISKVSDDSSFKRNLILANLIKKNEANSIIEGIDINEYSEEEHFKELNDLTNEFSEKLEKLANKLFNL